MNTANQTVRWALRWQPQHIDWACLLLRLGLGASLFAKHGYEKLTTFSAMRQHFPDPLHLGPTLSLCLALGADALCSVLVALGLFTRLASLAVAVNVAVAFGLVWGGSLRSLDGELTYAYLIGYLTVFLVGPGRYSLDHYFFASPGLLHRPAEVAAS